MRGPGKCSRTVCVVLTDMQSEPTCNLIRDQLCSTVNVRTPRRQCSDATPGNACVCVLATRCLEVLARDTAVARSTLSGHRRASMSTDAVSYTHLTLPT